MSFEDADNGFTHVLLYLGCTDGEAALRYDQLKCHQSLIKGIPYHTFLWLAVGVTLLIPKIKKRSQQVIPLLNIFRREETTCLATCPALGRLPRFKAQALTLMYAFQREPVI